MDWNRFIVDGSACTGCLGGLTLAATCTVKAAAASGLAAQIALIAAAILGVSFSFAIYDAYANNNNPDFFSLFRNVSAAFVNKFLDQITNTALMVMKTTAEQFVRGNW